MPMISSPRFQLFRTLLLTLIGSTTLGRARADERYLAPLDLLRRQYESHAILILAHTNHLDARPYALLESLLASIGADPRLKKIYLERSHDTAAFYEALSTRSLKESLRMAPFESTAQQTRSLCEPEWAYAIRELGRVVRAVNRQRKEPVQLSSFDSISSLTPLATEDQLWQPIRPTDCELPSDPATLFAASGNREWETAANFARQVVFPLRAGEKIIILYHYMHVTPELTSCLPFQAADGEWFARQSPTNWLSIALNRDPELRARVSILPIDGTPEGESHEGALKFGAARAAQAPRPDFALEASSFVEESERGVDVFLENSFVRNYHLGKTFGSATAAEMYDGYIWFDRPSARFAFPSAGNSLPEFCASESPSP